MSQFDLNLSRVFVLLYETGSVTATAAALHVTQPSVSYSLAKLRRHFDDELFHRTGHGLQPTSAARRIYEPLHRALAEIDGLLRASEAFTPATDPARFTLALSDVGEATLLPRLVEAAHRNAPLVSFTVRPLDVSDAERQLARGEIDAFIATPNFAVERGVRIPLFRERYVAMVAADHPRIRTAAMTIDQFRAERYATVYGPSGHLGPRERLAELGLLDRTAVEVTRFSVLPYLLEHSQLVTIVPEYAGYTFVKSHAVRTVELPFTIAPIEVALHARPASSRTPVQRWLIDFVVAVLGR